MPPSVPNCARGPQTPSPHLPTVVHVKRHQPFGDGAFFHEGKQDRGRFVGRALLGIQSFILDSVTPGSAQGQVVNGRPQGFARLRLLVKRAKHPRGGARGRHPQPQSRGIGRRRLPQFRFLNKLLVGPHFHPIAWGARAFNLRLGLREPRRHSSSDNSKRELGRDSIPKITPSPPSNHERARSWLMDVHTALNEP